LTGFNHENVGEEETRRMEAKENELFSLVQKEFLEG
jgi:hypothetical protein